MENAVHCVRFENANLAPKNRDYTSDDGHSSLSPPIGKDFKYWRVHLDVNRLRLPWFSLV